MSDALLPVSNALRLILLLTLASCHWAIETPESPPVDDNVYRPKVKALSSPGLGEVRIRFDGEVNQRTSESPMSYELFDWENGTLVPFAVHLMPDYKTVQLFVTGITNHRHIGLTVSTVKDVSEVYTMTSASYDMAIDDSEVPQVSLELLGSTFLRLSFTEPITIKSNSFLVLDGLPATLSAVTYPLEGDSTTALVQLTNDLTLGTHQYEILSGKFQDYVGNSNQASTGSISLRPGTYHLPTLVAVNVLDLHRVRFIFSQAVIVSSDSFGYSATSHPKTASILARDVMRLNDWVIDATFGELDTDNAIYVVTNVTDYFLNTLDPNPTAKKATSVP